MRIRSTPERWGDPAKFAHWATVALVITQFALAQYAERLPLGVDKLATLARHKSIGITILGLTLLRLLWRAFDGRPRRLGSGSLTDWVSRATHVLLYLLLLAAPLAGWIMSSARNFPVSWFGWFQLPDLVAPGEALYRAAHEVHESLTLALGLVALLHTLAALKHHFVDRDAVLRRMLPFTRRRT